MTRALVRAGQVVAVDGVVAELAFAPPCQTCPNRCLLGTEVERRIRVPLASSRLAVGDQAAIRVAGSELTVLCAVLFGIPLLAWVAGGMVGSQLWGDDVGALVALVMLAGALAAITSKRMTLRYRVKLELIALRGVSRVGQ